MTPTSKTVDAPPDNNEPMSGDVIPFGAAPLASAAEWGAANRVADLIPTPAKWEEYDQVEIDELVGADFLLQDAMFFDSSLPGQDGEWCIILGATKDGAQFTTMTGGQIVVRKLHKLMAFPVGGDNYRNMLPCVARITKHDSQTRGHSAYYDLI